MILIRPFKPSIWMCIAICFTLACESTGGSSRKDDSQTSGLSSSSTPSRQKQAAEYDDHDSGFIIKSSSNMFTSGGVVINSLSNNPLTSGSLDRGRALEQAVAIKDRTSTNESTKLKGLTSARLGGSDFYEVLEHTKSIMVKRAQKSQKVLPDLALLEVGLTSIQEKNIARARIFLEPLLASTKNSLIKASIHNAYGVAYLQTHDYTAAAQSFKKALRISPRFVPALYNMGLLALKFGHYRESQRYLSDMQEDWYVRSALITSDRHLNRKSRVSSLCSQLTRQKSSHKMILFNCGLFYLENMGQKDQARNFIERATQQSGGESGWDEAAFQAMEKLQ